EPGKGYKLYAKNLLSDTSFSYFPSGSFAGMNPIAVNTQTSDENRQETSNVTTALSDWKINPHAFESNMTITSILKINSAELAHDSVYVGAFVGDECRGVVKATYSRRYGRWYAFLMLYSNMVEEDNIRLRVYDMKRGEIWEMADSIAFKADAVLGTMSSPQVVNATKLYLRVGVGVEHELPQTYQLFANYPNPFNPGTQIKYALPERSHVQIKVFNTLGQLVKILVDTEEPAGYRIVYFDGTNLASGLYFFRLEAVSMEKQGNSFTEVQKMLLIK
ncbi:MAG: T9SS type A sorting domain-containing protein, partial [Ignavibacteriae bacterium]|nr:T9SS type A sorting domain-containing protein [Ignavibacteriota bacterium]